MDKNQSNKWAFKYLFESLKKQRIGNEIIKEIKGIIKERLLDKISVQIDCPNEFYDKISFTLFSGKREIINDFIRTIEEVRERETF